MKSIVILSGKGGVGKSSITASLAVLLARKKKIITIDCDVDAANLALVLGAETEKWKDIQTNERPELTREKCNACKKCLICAFSAISWDKENKIPVFNSMFCEGCGVCEIVCPENAIKLKKVKNAKIGISKTNYDFNVVTGQLKMGESGSGKVVIEVKNKAKEIAENQTEIMLVDSSPGIGCPVIASITGSDYAIGITEPTPSAFADLQRALQVVEHFKIPYGIIINKWDLNKKFTKKIEEYINKNNIQLLGKIPYDRKFVEALVNLKPIVVWDKKFEKIFENIINNIKMIR